MRERGDLISCYADILTDPSHHCGSKWVQNMARGHVSPTVCQTLASLIPSPFLCFLSLL